MYFFLSLLLQCYFPPLSLFLFTTVRKNMHLMHKNESLREFVLSLSPLSLSLSLSYPHLHSICSSVIFLRLLFPLLSLFLFLQSAQCSERQLLTSTQRSLFTSLSLSFTHSVLAFSHAFNCSLSLSSLAGDVQSYWCWNGSFQLIRACNNIQEANKKMQPREHMTKNKSKTLLLLPSPPLSLSHALSTVFVKFVRTM